MEFYKYQRNWALAYELIVELSPQPCDYNFINSTGYLQLKTSMSNALLELKNFSDSMSSWGYSPEIYIYMMRCRKHRNLRLEMSHKLDYLSSIPVPTEKWKERTDSTQLSSDTCTVSMACVYATTPYIIQIITMIERSRGVKTSDGKGKSVYQV